MLKHTRFSSVGTYFHGSTICTTVNKLLKFFRHSCQKNEDVRDKVQYEFTLEDNEGNIVTIYDWKECRHFREDEMITFNIGGKSEAVTEKARKYLESIL